MNVTIISPFIFSLYYTSLFNSNGNINREMWYIILRKEQMLKLKFLCTLKRPKFKEEEIRSFLTSEPYKDKRLISRLGKFISGKIPQSTHWALAGGGFRVGLESLKRRKPLATVGNRTTNARYYILSSHYTH
jgi:hypothetical protein